MANHMFKTQGVLVGLFFKTELLEFVDVWIVVGTRLEPSSKVGSSAFKVLHLPF